MINKLSTVLLALVMLVPTGFCFAGEDWQANLVVSSSNASSRLTFGQNQAATDLNDGFYDVSALFSGSLRAAFTDGGGTLWRDIRGGDNGTGQEWRLSVTAATGEIVKVSWDKDSLPKNIRVTLIEVDTGRSVDMKELSSYAVENRNGGELIIEVSNI